MNTISPDPFAALVHLRIEQLQQEAASDGYARAARASRRSRRSWPIAVAAVLRDSFARGNTSRAAAASRTVAPCPTC